MISTQPDAEAHAAPNSSDEVSTSEPPPSRESAPAPALHVEAQPTAPTTKVAIVTVADDAGSHRVTDPPATRPDTPSARMAVANIDTGSVAPVTRDTPDLDFGNDDEGFFTKSVDEVHAEELRRTAPDLHDDHARVALARRPRIDHRRARSFVVGVLGVCALIGATAMVRRTIGAPHRGASTEPTIAQAAAAPPPATVAAPQLELPTLPTAEEVVAPAPAPEAAPTAAPTPIEAPAPAPAIAEAAAQPVAVAAPTTAPTTVAAAPTEDPDASLSGAQLLAAARSAINGNNAPRAAALARKAIAKGAGGSAQYVLGAAYQAMGANAGAKSAYAACAKSGAAEAGECAALVDSL